jgi:hypothetical protein
MPWWQENHVWEPPTRRFCFEQWSRLHCDQFKVKVTLWLTVSQSVSMSWCRAQSGTFDQTSNMRTNCITDIKYWKIINYFSVCWIFVTFRNLFKKLQIQDMICILSYLPIYYRWLTAISNTILKV